MSKSTKRTAKPVVSAKVAAATAKRAKAQRKAPGNARALQQKAADNTAKLAKQASRVESIKTAVNARSGNGLVVTTSRDRSIVIQRVDGQVNKLALVGLPVQPLEAYLAARPAPQARLANGVDARTAPHSAKAVADQRGAASKSAKAAAPKAAKAKQPATSSADRDYTRGKTAIAAKPDSWRGHMLGTITKHTNTAKARAAHAKSGKFSNNKLDFNWAAAQGYIVWAK